MVDLSSINFERSTTNEPSFLEGRFRLDWQMTRPERFAFLHLLDVAGAEVALEIGSYRGGSLQCIAAAARKVYSVDIDTTVPERLGQYFSNVEFRCGDSSGLLPGVIQEIQHK